MTPPPTARTADIGVIDPFDPHFSAFVFKIQANMNKAHRDRLAFMRICSGKFQRDAEYFHVQGNKKMRLSQPQQLMAAEREIVDEATPGTSSAFLTRAFSPSAIPSPFRGRSSNIPASPPLPPSISAGYPPRTP